jgi:hypothetical protein
MLTENKTVRQRPEEGYRRWFVSSYFDIIIWYVSKGGKLKGFQVCYSKNHDEKAFTWEENSVSSHFVTDSFTERGMSGMATSILHGDAGLIPDEMIQHLTDEQGDLDQDLYELILDKIEDYNSKK